MIVLVCGDRNWTDSAAIHRELEGLLTRVRLETSLAAACVWFLEVVEGEAPGADSMSRDAAVELGVPVHRFPADWSKYGRAAGPVRNTQMLKYLLSRKEEGEQILVMAFHSDLEHSKGTKNMVMQAEKAGVEVWKFKA